MLFQSFQFFLDLFWGTSKMIGTYADALTHSEKPILGSGLVCTGMSRGKRGSMVKIRIGENEDGLTDNIVYSELLM